MKSFRILIADDHHLVRLGLRTLLEQQNGWEICGEAANGREALKLAKQLKPDVIVMDARMPVLDGLEATRRLRRELPDVRVLLLTSSASEQAVPVFLKAGAHACVAKSQPAATIIQALNAMREGRIFMTLRTAEMVLDHFGRQRESRGKAAAGSPLTDREMEILSLMAEAKTTKEIAYEMSISARTVEVHRSNIMHKLNLRSSTEMIRYAVLLKTGQV